MHCRSKFQISKVNLEQNSKKGLKLEEFKPWRMSDWKNYTCRSFSIWGFSSTLFHFHPFFEVMLKLPYTLLDLCMTIIKMWLQQMDWVVLLIYFQAIDSNEYFFCYFIVPIYSDFIRGLLSGNSVFLTNTPCWSYKPSPPLNRAGGEAWSYKKAYYI